MSEAKKITGKLIIFEGMDGCGKSTQSKLFEAFLIAKGFDVLWTREPGGTPVAEDIRSIALKSALSEEPIEPMTELYLMAASRVQHIKNVILPALYSGKVVICDRFIASTMAYQGAGRDLAKPAMDTIVDTLKEYGMMSHSEFMYTIYLQVSLETSNDRLIHRATNKGLPNDGNRLDDEKQSFKKKVHQGYEWFLASHPNVVKINGEDSVNGVTKLIQDWAINRFIPNNVYLIKDVENA